MAQLTVVDHPVAASCLASLRDARTDIVGFRAATARIAPLLVAEATRHLPTLHTQVVTPVASAAEVATVRSPLVAIVVLRAGIGLLPAVVEQHPDALVGFVDVHRDEETLSPVEHRRIVPQAAGAAGLVLEPMLATGGSGAVGVRALLDGGAASVAVVSVVATPPAVDRIDEEYPGTRIVTAALDPRLTARGYISPGLGDFGDRLLSVSAPAGEAGAAEEDRS